MKEIVLPNHFNYIGVFLSLRCNLNCSYCVNHQGEFVVPDELTGIDWIKGLSRIKTSKDFPITLQGGEPTIHRDFYSIAATLHDEHKKHIDLLTNGKFNLGEFMGNIHRDVFNRKKLPFVSIRISYHHSLNEWYLMEKLGILKSNGYNIGVFGLSHADNDSMKQVCEDIGVNFTIKEYLDKHKGTYKYPDAINGIQRHALCKPSELLIAPDGKLYRCHSDLYAGINSYGHILDEEVKIPDDFVSCDRFGLCNSCDIKEKTNRLLEKGYTSVEIKEC